MLYTTVGIHPHYSDSFNCDSINYLEELADNPRVVAIGETGLDFNRNFSSQKNQINVFEHQLELAASKQIPLFMHSEAQQQLEILRTTGSLYSRCDSLLYWRQKTLFNYLDLDLYIGITGWICDERRGLEL